MSKHTGYSKINDILNNPGLVWERCDKEYRFHRYIGVPIHVRYRDDAIDMEQYVMFTNVFHNHCAHVYEGFNLRTGDGVALDVNYIYDALTEGRGWFRFPHQANDSEHRVRLVSERKYNELRRLWLVQEVQDS